MKQFPSIFNDVIGPVMIGHSSSHTAASVRIGSAIRQLAGASAVTAAHFSFDKDSSIAATYHAQGSDSALLAGILGFDTSDSIMLDALKIADYEGIKYSFEVKELEKLHPNAYFISCTFSDGSQVSFTATSTGGGAFEIVNYMGFPVLIDGGFYETLITCEISKTDLVMERVRERLPKPNNATVFYNGEASLINIKSEQPIDLGGLFLDATVRQIGLIMPIQSQLEPDVPFVTGEEIIRYAEDSGLPLWRLALMYESGRSGLSEQMLIEKMRNIIHVLKKSLETPIKDESCNRILKNQASLFEGKVLLGGSFQKSVLKYVTQFMDIKTSMGVFVAAPTAGACACLPGTLFALMNEREADDEALLRGMFSAGLVGVLVAYYSTFAAEICGCQAECGAASGMTAAACAEIKNASAEECLSAASMALQNIFGMICDPVCNKVEVPCLGKNVMCAFNGIASANMALAGLDPVIPIDETIVAMDAVGKSIPRELRCTGLGGLSVTKTAFSLKKKLDKF